MILSLTIHLPTPLSLCIAISHKSCTYTVIPCQPCPCTVIPSQSCPCKLELYCVCHNMSHFQTSKASIQPRDRAVLLSKQSAHTNPNLIRIQQLDTRIGLEPHPYFSWHLTIFCRLENYQHNTGTLSEPCAYS